MASRRIEDLRPEMQAKARAHVKACKARGVDLLIYCTLRSAEEQAKLYRINRSAAQIAGKVSTMRRRGFPRLAQLIVDVGPQPDNPGGGVVTMAGPGESYHQYGLAYDAVPLVGGRAVWNARHPAWAVVEETARACGLERLSWEMGHYQQPGIDIKALMRDG